MDALIWQMAKLHCLWEPNNYRLPFLCPSMLLSVVLHRPGMQILRNGCVSSQSILEEGLPTPCGDLSPEPLLKRLSSPRFLSMASSEGQWDGSTGSLSMSPRLHKAERIDHWKLPFDLRPLASLSHIYTSWLYVLRLIFALSSFSGLSKPFSVRVMLFWLL